MRVLLPLPTKQGPSLYSSANRSSLSIDRTRSRAFSLGEGMHASYECYLVRSDRSGRIVFEIKLGISDGFRKNKFDAKSMQNEPAPFTLPFRLPLLSRNFDKSPLSPLPPLSFAAPVLNFLTCIVPTYKANCGMDG